jgi:UDP:flavonoid glycosyltransferase YjiC (YdhE family)
LGQVPDAVTRLLNQPRFTDAARAVAAEMAALPDVDQCAAVLQDLAR